MALLLAAIEGSRPRKQDAPTSTMLARASRVGPIGFDLDFRGVDDMAEDCLGCMVSNVALSSQSGQQPDCSALPSDWAGKLNTRGRTSADLARLTNVAYRAGGVDVYPPRNDVFRAFYATPFDRVRLVIVGQDPPPEARPAPC